MSRLGAAGHLPRVAVWWTAVLLAARRSPFPGGPERMVEVRP